MSTVNIEHTGTIKEKRGNMLIVSIIPHSACASCSVGGGCSASSAEEKIVEIFDYSGNYEVGERVDVYYAQALGFQALFLGYVLPFILLMAVLMIVHSITGNEGLAGLASLAILVPYYLGLYLTRDLIKKKFTFQIRPKAIIHKVNFSYNN